MFRMNLRGFALALALACSPAAAQLQALPTREGLPTLAPVIERISPAVVNIAVLQRSPEERNPLLRDPFFRCFFGLPGAERPQISAGSGVIVAVNRRRVATVAELAKALGGAERAALTVLRGDFLLTIVIRG